jgi:hypothetical protein
LVHDLERRSPLLGDLTAMERLQSRGRRLEVSSGVRSMAAVFRALRLGIARSDSPHNRDNNDTDGRRPENMIQHGLVLR